MGTRRNAVLVTAAIASFGVYAFADRLEVARAILPPRASKIQLLRYAIRPPFQIATPNTSLIRKVRISLVPGVQACTDPPCDGTKAVASCNNNCGYCGHCPDCLKGPCTIYTCTTGASNQYCQSGWNTGSCTACELDSTVRCHTPP